MTPRILLGFLLTNVLSAFKAEDRRILKVNELKGRYDELIQQGREYMLKYL